MSAYLFATPEKAVSNRAPFNYVDGKKATSSTSCIPPSELRVLRKIFRKHSSSPNDRLVDDQCLAVTSPSSLRSLLFELQLLQSASPPEEGSAADPDGAYALGQLLGLGGGHRVQGEGAEQEQEQEKEGLLHLTFDMFARWWGGDAAAQSEGADKATALSFPTRRTVVMEGVSLYFCRDCPAAEDGGALSIPSINVFLEVSRPLHLSLLLDFSNSKNLHLSPAPPSSAPPLYLTFPPSHHLAVLLDVPPPFLPVFVCRLSYRPPSPSTSSASALSAATWTFSVRAHVKNPSFNAGGRRGPSRLQAGHKSLLARLASGSVEGGGEELVDDDDDNDVDNNDDDDDDDEGSGPSSSAAQVLTGGPTVPETPFEDLHERVDRDVEELRRAASECGDETARELDSYRGPRDSVEDADILNKLLAAREGYYSQLKIGEERKERELQAMDETRTDTSEQQPPQQTFDTLDERDDPQWKQQPPRFIDLSFPPALASIVSTKERLSFRRSRAQSIASCWGADCSKVFANSMIWIRCSQSDSSTAESSPASPLSAHANPSALIFPPQSLAPRAIRGGSLAPSHPLPFVLRALLAPQSSHLLPSPSTNQCFITSLFLDDCRPYLLGCGILRLRLNLVGRWSIVSIDDFLPSFGGPNRPPFVSARPSPSSSTTSAPSSPPWPPILEKALAKSLGSYAALSRASAESPDDLVACFSDVTGCPATAHKIGASAASASGGDDDRLFNETLRPNLVVGNVVLCSVGGGGRKVVSTPHSIGGETTRALKHAVEIDGVRIFKVWDWWGDFLNWRGEWGNDSSLWTDRMKAKVAERAGVRVEDVLTKEQDVSEDHGGGVWLSETEFSSLFSSVTVCRLRSSKGREWSVLRSSVVFSSSTASQSSSDSVAQPPSFSRSAQSSKDSPPLPRLQSRTIRLHVAHRCNAVVALHQADRRAALCSPAVGVEWDDGYRSFGITILKRTQPGKGGSQRDGKGGYSIVAASGERSTRDTSTCEFTLEEGEYLIVPYSTADGGAPTSKGGGGKLSTEEEERLVALLAGDFLARLLHGAADKALGEGVSRADIAVMAEDIWGGRETAGRGKLMRWLAGGSREGNGGGDGEGEGEGEGDGSSGSSGSKITKGSVKRALLAELSCGGKSRGEGGKSKGEVEKVWARDIVNWMGYDVEGIWAGKRDAWRCRNTFCATLTLHHDGSTAKIKMSEGGRNEKALRDAIALAPTAGVGRES